MTSYVHLAAVYLIWGSTYFAVRVIVGDGDVSPVVLQFARAAVAAVLLGVVALVLARQRGAKPATQPRALGLAALSGVLMWAGGNGLATYAAGHTSSSFIVMAMGTIPLWTVIVESAITRNVPPPRVLGALLVGLAGLGLVVAPGLTSSDVVESGYALPTVLMLLGGGVTWAIGTAVQKRVATEFSVPALSAVQFSAAAVVLALPAAVIGSPSMTTLTPARWVAFGYLVIFGSAISLSSYAIVVRRFSPTIASTFAYVNPLVGVLLGAFVLREHVQPISIAGLIVVLVAVAGTFGVTTPAETKPSAGASSAIPTASFTLRTRTTGAVTPACRRSAGSGPGTPR